MKRFMLAALSAAVGFIAMPGVSAAANLDTAQIEKLTGLKGALNADQSVFKVSAPREDIKVSVDGWAMPPFMGLTTWAAFTLGKKDSAMVMGDFVLLQDEVNPVMSAALENGLQVTALHNHFFYDEPRIFFMHIGGEGSEEKLASAVGRMLGTIRDIRTRTAGQSTDFGGAISSSNSITPGPIESILGTKGQSKDGMTKITIGRKTKMKCDCETGKDMGVNTWAAFAGSDAQAVVDGDFAMEEDELQGVLKALRAAKINVVAIHNHMTEESPRIMFLHFWGKGAAADLARGVRSALDAQR